MRLKPYSSNKLHLSIFLAFIILCFQINTQPILAAVPAFPGAEGFGADTPGGRGGTIYEITNLNDSGTGSLRNCINASGPRICIFKVGGTIILNSSLTILNPYITIAGQTAPGGGIAIKNNRSISGGSPSLFIKTHDVVIRYITVRPGPPSNSSSDGDAILSGYNNNNIVYNVIIDHCSLSWGIDEVFCAWYSNHDMTIQWSIVSEGLDCSTHTRGCHSKGALLGGNAFNESGTGLGAENISFHHNLLAHNGERSPMIKTSGLADIVNNVSYDPHWEFSYVDMMSKSVIPVNYIGNYFKYGPSSTGSYEIMTVKNGGNGAAIYVKDNIGPHRTSDSQAQDLVVMSASRGYLVSTRHTAPPITTTTAQEAYTQVLAHAGNSQGLDNLGNWYTRQDAVDKRIIEEVKRKEGKIIDAPGASTCIGACRGSGYYLTSANYTKYGITDPLDADGWPVIALGVPYTDSDHDGMSNDWENKFGFNPNDPSDGSRDADGDGYTNVEEFLNMTNPKDNLVTPPPTSTPTPSPTPAYKNPDLNSDGRVDSQDFKLLLAYWGSVPTGTPEDLDGNNEVNSMDAAMIILNWKP